MLDKTRLIWQLAFASLFEPADWTMCVGKCLTLNSHTIVPASPRSRREEYGAFSPRVLYDTARKKDTKNSSKLLKAVMQAVQKMKDVVISRISPRSKGSCSDNVRLYNYMIPSACDEGFPFYQYMNQADRYFRRGV